MFLYPDFTWVLCHRLSPGIWWELPALVFRLTVTFMFEPAFLLIDISSKPVGIWATKKAGTTHQALSFRLWHHSIDPGHSRCVGDSAPHIKKNRQSITAE